MIKYRIIDLNTYPHKAHLEYFVAHDFPTTGLTANVDVTELVQFCKEEQCSFNLAVMHILALAADAQPQFRQRIHRLTEKEKMDPAHAGYLTEGPLAGLEIREYEVCPTSSTESIGHDLYGYLSLQHYMPWKEYITQAISEQAKVREHGSIAVDDEIEAYYFATAIPWVHFTHMVHPWTDACDSNPRFCCGKYEEDFKGRLMMPLNLAVNHGLVDGLQMGRFYEIFEKKMADLVAGRL